VVCLDRVIGYCETICSDCPVLIATRKNDNAERMKVAALFTKQYGIKFKSDGRPYEPGDINCDGCVSDGSRVFGYCVLCGIRKCGREKKVKSCAYCQEYPCGRLSELFSKYSKAKETLDSVRRECVLRENDS